MNGMSAAQNDAAQPQLLLAHHRGAGSVAIAGAGGRLVAGRGVPRV